MIKTFWTEKNGALEACIKAKQAVERLKYVPGVGPGETKPIEALIELVLEIYVSEEYSPKSGSLGLDKT